MSRKNKNARRNAFVCPIVTDPKSLNHTVNHAANLTNPVAYTIGANQATATQNVAKPHITMCDDKCGFEYKSLMSTMLDTDFSYQRKIDSARVDRIVAGFDARLVNTVKVSNRDGHFYVFDGAHTLAALKRIHGDQPFSVDCKVFYGLTYEEEAYLFALQTGESKDVAFGVRMRAMLISHSAEAEAFRAHTAAVGLTLSENEGSATKGVIVAIAKAYRLFDTLGADEYENVLRLIANTWGGAAWSLTSYILGGVAVFLREYGEEYNRERFIRRLRGATYEELRDEARRQQRSSSDIAHALAITKVYNRSGGRGTVDPRLLTMKD